MAYRNTPISTQAYRRQTLIFALLAFMMLAAPVHADFSIDSGVSQRIDNTLNTRAELSLELGAQTQKALTKGIPLNIIVEMVLAQPRFALWDKKIAQWQFVYELSYHALTGRYIVRPQGETEMQSFSTLTEALSEISGFSTTWAPDNFTFEDNADYSISLRVRLDTNSLPTPLRAMVLIRPDWRLKSGWEQWPVQ